MKVSLAFLTAISMIAVPSSSPKIGEKTAEITNASWQEVPDTASTAEGYVDPAYININGISRNSDRVIFEVINPDVSYGRVEGNCSTNQIRSLRIGYFLSKTQVSYIEQNSEFWNKANSYQINILKFACNNSEKNNFE
ncbi:MAG: hypothetical protein AB1861_16110 [Cyanobacteriota bacterium]